MADDTTKPKQIRIEPRLSTEPQDIEAINDLSREQVEAMVYDLITADGGVIHGMRPTFQSSVTLVDGRDIEVGRGAAIHQGQFAKIVDPQPFTLDENPFADPRCDVLELVGLAKVATDQQSRIVMGPLTRSSFGSPSPTLLGTGDGSQTTFDLPHNKTDLYTLKAHQGSGGLYAQSGGFNFSEGSAAGGEDQLIFDEAPASGVEVAASGHYHTGGEEANANVETRYTIVPQINLVKGTPDANASQGAGIGTLTLGGIVLARIVLPASWTGGSSGVDFQANSAIRPMVIAEDDPAFVPSPSSILADKGLGRLVNPIRNAHQLLEGFRLRYNGASSLQVTPGFAIKDGYSCRSESDITVALSGLTANAWHFVYLEIGSTGPGQPPALQISTDPPNSARKKTGVVAPKLLYVGAIFATSPTQMREFATDGDWVSWLAPTAVNLGTATDGSAVDVNLADWVPPTARLLDVQHVLNFEMAANDYASVNLNSHMVSNARAYPSMEARHYAESYPASTTIQRHLTGRLRIYDDGSGAYINKRNIFINTSAGPGPTITNNDLYVQGYLDDYRTLSTTGVAGIY